MEEQPIIPSPSSIVVAEKPKVILYTHDDKPIVRVIGFRKQR